MWRQRVGTHGLHRIAEAAKILTRPVHTEKRDHVVLVDAVTGYANSTDKLVAAINRHATRENLCAVGELADYASRSKSVVKAIDAGAVHRHIGSCCQDETNVLHNRVVNEVELQSGRERAPLPRRFAERAVRVARHAIRVERPRQVAACTIGECNGTVGQCIWQAKEVLRCCYVLRQHLFAQYDEAAVEIGCRWHAVQCGCRRSG